MAYYHSRPRGSQEAYPKNESRAKATRDSFIRVRGLKLRVALNLGRWAHIRRVGFIVVFIKRQDMEVGRPQVSYPTQDLAPRGPASRSRASNAAEEADTYGGSKEDISTRE